MAQELAPPHFHFETSVLLVEDDENIRDLLGNFFDAANLRHRVAADADQAVALFDDDPTIAVVLTDVVMPNRNGFDLLRALRTRKGRDAEYIVMTGYGGEEAALNALRVGAADILQKPLNMRHLERVLNEAIRRVTVRRSQSLHRKCLEAEVSAKTTEIRGLLESVESAYIDSLECLAVASEYKDQETGCHIRRIGAYAREIAAAIGLSAQEQRHIELAAPLHDVGKIGIPDAILLKPGTLTAEEFAVMRQHPVLGHTILSAGNHPVMRCAAAIALGHHERYDGGGYPHGLKGRDIPIAARITQLCDVYDALRSARPYKPAMAHVQAVRTILEGDGRTAPAHFDPAVLDAFKRTQDRFARIFDAH